MGWPGEELLSMKKPHDIIPEKPTSIAVKHRGISSSSIQYPDQFIEETHKPCQGQGERSHHPEEEEVLPQDQ